MYFRYILTYFSLMFFLLIPLTVLKKIVNLPSLNYINYYIIVICITAHFVQYDHPSVGLRHVYYNIV